MNPNIPKPIENTGIYDCFAPKHASSGLVQRRGWKPIVEKTMAEAGEFAETPVERSGFATRRADALVNWIEECTFTSPHNPHRNCLQFAPSFQL